MRTSGLIAVGSGPAGLSAAAAFRARHPKLPVQILTADPAMPYAKPPLSKDFLCGRGAALDLHSPEWFDQRGIELIRGLTVDHIDVAQREVVTRAGRRYPYWHLVLAPGARPVPLDIPGAANALALRSLGDAVAIRMSALQARSAIVIGGGLIGCEAAACLAGSGIVTTMVAGEPVPLYRRFGLDAGERIAKLLTDCGVRFVGPARVTEVHDDGVTLDSGARLEGDLVVAATGVRPDARLAIEAGIATQQFGRASRIVVNRRMHTSAPNVFAAGDIALAYNVTARRAIPTEHWRDAADQGEIAGSSAAGYPMAWGAVPGFFCSIGDVRLKYRGWGLPYDRAHLVEHRDGFTVRYEAGGEPVGVLCLNADEDYRAAGEKLRNAPAPPVRGVASATSL
ncbi:pyridine nucleotide-disulfide oxidoreductase [Mycobacterium sp. 852013-51886_SCH5428379]|uniref:NAD(P)/FAD-dependent oxidoreductase n=1 Tax=Mycobacterium sp. 852013-51886_SCH5428379 TaxID=1834111 RepID=UPI0007FD481A|nr:NAD(P)/FAD-dependent oxidoreductase [Mycobacterium sp. 852013-51886_SCH5428379]OBB57146.1 pyridine nucleotide-disulfide oxidoreductase [Mycobacterium sp. 852013-51886_SCH5428379]